MEAEDAAEMKLKSTEKVVRHNRTMVSNASDVETELKVGAATDEAASSAAKAESESRRAEPSRAEAIRNARAGDQIKGYTKAAQAAEAAKEARVTAREEPVGIHGEPLEEGFGYGAMPTKSAVAQAGDELIPATALKKKATEKADAAESPSTADVAKIAVAADAAAGATAEMEMTAKDEMDARSAAMATANAEAEAEAEKAQAELSADQVLQAEGAQASQASEQQEGAQAAGGPRCRSIMPAVPDEWCEASCAVSAQSCPTTHCKCDGDGAEPSLNAHAAAYATVKAQGKQLVEAAKAKRLANKNGGQAGVDFRRLASLPPGAAVPVQGVPPMSDITAGMPGLDFNERGLGETDNPEGAHKGEHSPAHHATRLTRTAEGVVATEGVTDGVHGPHGESMSLSPEPASGTGLHGEKFGAARTHDPSARATVAPSEIGVHSETASEIASGQPADGSALAPASEGKHTGSTLTIGRRGRRRAVGLRRGDAQAARGRGGRPHQDAARRDQRAAPAPQKARRAHPRRRDRKSVV